MLFYAKKDWFFPVVLLFVALIYGGVSLIILFTEDDLNALYGLAIVFCLLTFLFWLIQKTTSYRIGNHEIICRMLFLKKSIPINSIRSIEKANGMYVGRKMNTAWKCIIVKYNTYDELLISPDEELRFIETLLAINPKIYVKTTS
jgi:hypothetical protein